MRTNPAAAVALYNDLTLKQAAEALGISVEMVLGLGEDGALEVIDYRRTGAKKGVYRVSAESVKALREKRIIRPAQVSA